MFNRYIVLYEEDNNIHKIEYSFSSDIKCYNSLKDEVKLPKSTIAILNSNFKILWDKYNGWDSNRFGINKAIMK